MPPSFSLEGRTAIVTGGSKGIGYAIAEAFVAAGSRVIITARGEEALHAAAARLGINAIALRCDNGDPADIARMMEAAWRLGPVDILVNNAGINGVYRRAEHVTVDDWDTLMDINLRGAYFCCTELARRLFEAERPGSIVNVSSVGGLVPLERLSIYNSAKAALIQMAKSLALEWADRGVRVNAIAPGWTETDFTADLMASRHGPGLTADVPMGRNASADEIAGAALYLASDASSYTTGAVIAVDGGRSLR